MIDVELVTRKILLVVRDLDALRPIAAKARDAYLSSGLDEAAAERYLERLIGRRHNAQLKIAVHAMGRM